MRATRRWSGEDFSVIKRGRSSISFGCQCTFYVYIYVVMRYEKSFDKLSLLCLLIDD